MKKPQFYQGPEEAKAHVDTLMMILDLLSDFACMNDGQVMQLTQQNIIPRVI